MKRRELLLASGAVLLSSVALGGPKAKLRRMVRRKVRRKIRRRYRRRVLWRAVGPRRALVVPVAMAIGWELAVAAEKAGGPDEIVIVKEVKSPTLIVVQAADGKTREIEVVKEDNADNGKDLDGSELAENDATAGRDGEIEEEKEVEE